MRQALSHHEAGLVFLLLLVPGAAVAELGLSPLFSDGMVLQREQPIVVWGVAPPGVEVRVEFEGATAVGGSSEEGRWQVELPARAAGGPSTSPP